MVLIFLLSAAIILEAQQTIAFQGFESSAQDNWNFTPPTQNPSLPQVIVGIGNFGVGYSRTGNNSCRLGGGSTTCGTGSSNCVNGSGSGGSCSNNLNGLEVEFAPIDVSGFTDLTISVGYRTHILCSNGGSGLDASDRVFFEVQLNGGAWNTVATILGSNDCTWTYTTNPVQCGGNPAVANPYIYHIPECTSTVAFRVRILINRTDEVFYVDDVTLSGTPGGIVFNPIQIQHIDP
ncbi:MAG: hypothetical protein ACK4GL_11785 [Flavobacteriales bacterium]